MLSIYILPFKKRNSTNTFQKCIVSVVAILGGHVFLFEVMTVQGQREECIDPGKEKNL